MWIAMIATTSDTISGAVFAWRTNRIVATIAPGPASNGVPSGTIATLTSSTSVGSSVFPVSSSSETTSSSRPPETCMAGSEIPRNCRIRSPSSANSTMTPNAVSAACSASRAIAFAPRRPASARNTGMTPGGSMITNSAR